MAEYRFSRAAWRDLDGIFDYTVTQWGLPQALRHVDLVEAACPELAEAPQHSHSCANIRPGYRRRSVGRRILHFRPTPNGIAIIRILHQRMDATRHL